MGGTERGPVQNLEENLGMTIRFGDFTKKEAVS